MKIKNPGLKVVPCLVALGLLLSPLAAIADVLQGGVQQTDIRTLPKPALNRHDIDNNSDPFQGKEEETLDAPKELFKAPPQQRPAQHPLKAAIQDQGAPAGIPQTPRMAAPENMPIDGEPDQIPEQPRKPLEANPQYNPQTPQDPEASGQMGLLWDQWHKRVAQTIFERFNFIAQTAFKGSRPLMSAVSYTVTREGRIQNLQVQQRSSNMLFNIVIMQAIKSLDGDLSVLAFPPGSQRQFVPKTGTFTQNYGGQAGFRHTTNDYETTTGAGQRRQ